MRVKLNDDVELKGMGMMRYSNFVARYLRSIVMFIPNLFGLYEEE